MGREDGELARRYTVKLNKKARKGLDGLAGNRRTEADRFLLLLQTDPKVSVPGKTKKLKGAYERLGYRQFDLPDGYRIQYRIDEASLTVYVDYLGPHP